MDLQPTRTAWRNVRRVLVAAAILTAIVLLIWRWLDRSILTLPAHSGGFFGIAFHPDGKILASGGRDGVVRLWNVRSGVLEASFSGAGWSVAYSPDGELLIAWSPQGPVRLFSARSHQLVRVLSGSAGPAAFHPDSRHVVAAGGDAIVRVWETETESPARQLYKVIDDRFASFNFFSFRHDGQLLTFANVGPPSEIKIVDFRTGQLVSTLEGHG